MYKQFKKLWKITIVALVSVLTLVACGGGSGSNAEQTLRLASANPLNSLNHASTSEAANFLAIGNFLEGLITYDENGVLKGSMAETWEQSADGLTWTFNLRDGIVWSNGEPVTAADFVFGWQTLATGSDSPYATTLMDGKVKNAEAVIKGDKAPSELGAVAQDDQTFVVTLDAPCVFFDKLMAFGPLFPINEAFYTSVGGESVFGTSVDTVLANGPFVLTEYAPDTNYVLEKNPDYWDAKNVKLEKVETRIVQEPTTQATLYENGEIDRLQLVNADLYDQYKEDPNLVTQGESAWFYMYISGNNGSKSPVLANHNFRAAVAHAIDKEVITEQILKNGSTPANYLVPKDFDQLDGKDFRDYANQYNESIFDVAKATEYLAAAKAELGDTPLTFDLTIAEAVTSKKIYENIKAQIEQNLPGVTVNLKTLPSQTYYPTLRELNTNSASGGWGADYIDIATYFMIFKAADSHNYGQWNNADYEKYVALAEAETDPQARWDYYVQAEQILIEDYTILPIYQRGAATLLNPNVKGYSLNPVAPDIFFKYVYMA